MQDQPTTDPTSTAAKLGFDPDALRNRYRAERDKRVRADGNDQYVEVAGKFAHFVDDPYVDPGFRREPITDEVEVLVIGGGFGGLLMGVRLREAGVTDLRILEKAGDFGGTWYWNRYPGAACDVESYIYLPLLEEVGYVPKEKYSGAPEILEHSRAIARKYDLYRGAIFQTAVTSMRWDEPSGRWVVETDRGDAIRARFVCMANGPLDRPKLPGLPGLESFEGHCFHTSRWDYAYTGGGPEGGLVGLADKNVGIIGTGATAVQCIPHLAEGAKHLWVFQRTPSSIDVRANRPTDPAWAASLEPGWQKRRMENFNILVTGGMQDEDLVADGWTDIIRKLLVMVQRDASQGEPIDIVKTMELADFEKMEQIRARVESIVKDERTAEALKPWYRQFCKRPCFHDGYLQAFNRPNVTLVDTAGRGVERITPRGIVAAGVEYPLDCIVYASGFEVGTSFARRAGYDVVGRDGVRLSEHWADGVRTLHGIHSHGFPNCFMLGTQQAGFTVNFPHRLDEQARHVAFVLGRVRETGARRIEVTAEAEQEWIDTIISLSGMGRQFLEECTPGYYNNEGKPNLRSAQDGFYGAGPIAYFGVLRRWRDEGTMPGMVVEAGAAG